MDAEKVEKVITGLDTCFSGKKCESCGYEKEKGFCLSTLGEDALSVIRGLQAEIDRLKAGKVKEEIKVGDEVASVNPATGELNLWNTFIVTEIGENYIGGINSKGETHFHDEPGVFNIWAKTGKHIDILRAFEPVETASAKDSEQK